MYDFFQKVYASITSFSSRLWPTYTEQSSCKRLRDEIVDITEDDDDDDDVIICSPKKLKLQKGDFKTNTISTVTQTDNNITRKTLMKPRPWRFHLSTKENWNGAVEVVNLVEDTPNKFKNQYRPPQHVKSPHRIRRKPFSSKQKNDLRNSPGAEIKVLSEKPENIKQNSILRKNWSSEFKNFTTMAHSFQPVENGLKDMLKRSQRPNPECGSLERDEYFKLLNSFINKERQPSKIASPTLSPIKIDLTADSSDEMSSTPSETKEKKKGRHLKLFEGSSKNSSSSASVSEDRTKIQPKIVTARRRVRPSTSSCVDISRNKSSSQIISLVDDEDDDDDSSCEIIKTPPVTRVNSLQDKIKAQSSVSQEQWTSDLIRKYEEKKTELEEMTKMLSMELKIASDKKRSAFNDITLKMLTKHLEITEAFLDEEPSVPALPELTDDMMAVIQKACIKHPPDEVLIEKYNYKIRRCDIYTLTGLNWLNDEIINFYTTLIMERSKSNSDLPKTYSFSTFFYLRLANSGYQGVKRWTKKVDIFAHDLIIIPVHLQMHWCLAAIDRENKTINYYDSMGTNNDPCLKHLEQYLISEYQDKKGQALSMDGWSKNNLKDIPRQNNGSDCGVFSCTFAEFLSRRAKFTFQQEDMPYLRKKMIYEIVTGKLLT